MGPFARGSRFPKTLRGKAAVKTKNFFTELKRRNVYKVAVVYAVVAWLLIQVATQVFPFFEIPNWAVRLDPKFALSWALLSNVEARGYITQSLQPTAALREEARQAAETALTLQPNLGEALLAKGHYYYACLKDYEAAVRYFEQARQLLPNSSRIPESLAYVARRQGPPSRSRPVFCARPRVTEIGSFLIATHG